MTVRDHLGRSLAVSGALAVLGIGGLTMTERALAVPPPATAGATNVTTPYNSAGAQNNRVIGPYVTSPVTVSTITVPADGPSVLTDLDLRTFIEHSASGDLDIELRSPAGPSQRIVKLIGQPNTLRGTDDVFDGTLWDDSELTLASDLDSVDFAADPNFDGRAPQAALAPEGSLGKFVGIDPRGVWELRVTDRIDDNIPDDGDPTTPPPPAVDGGTLKSWSLQITSQTPAPPVIAPAITVTQAASSGTIASAPAATTSVINVSGQKGYLWDLDLITNITHTNPGELDITLSHGGRTVTISTGSDGATGFFAGRTFDDSASVLVGRAAEGSTSPLVPEGALAAFRGMDPNGVWTLSATDNGGPANTGTLSGFSLKIQATDANLAGPPVTPPVTPPVVAPPAVNPAPTTTSLPTGPPSFPLGLNRFAVVKNAQKSTVKLNLGWLDGTGRVTYTATLSTKFGTRTVTKVVRGSGAAGPKSIARTISVPKAWKGKRVTLRLVVKNAGTSIVRTKVIARF